MLTNEMLEQHATFHHSMGNKTHNEFTAYIEAWETHDGLPFIVGHRVYHEDAREEFTMFVPVPGAMVESALLSKFEPYTAMIASVMNREILKIKGEGK